MAANCEWSDMTIAKLGTYSDKSVFAPYRAEIINVLSNHLSTELIQQIRFLNGFEVENTINRKSGVEEATEFVMELNSKKLLSLSYLKSQLRHFEQIKLVNELDEICSKLDPSELELDRRYAEEDIRERMVNKSRGFLLRDPAARIAVVNTFRDGMLNFDGFKIRYSPPLSGAEVTQCSSVIKLLQLLDTRRTLCWRKFLANLEDAGCFNEARNLRKNFTQHKVPFDFDAELATVEVEDSDVTIETFFVPNAEDYGDKPWRSEKYFPIGTYTNGKSLECVRVDLIKIVSSEVLPSLQAPLCFLYQIDLGPLAEKQSFEERSTKFLEQLSSRRELCVTLLIEILCYLEAVSIAAKLQSIFEQVDQGAQALDREYCNLVKLKLSSKKTGINLKQLRYRLCLARTFRDLPLQVVKDFGRIYSETGSPPKFPPVMVDELQDVFKLFVCVDAAENGLDWNVFKEIVSSIDALSLYVSRLKKSARELSCLALM